VFLLLQGQLWVRAAAKMPMLAWPCFLCCGHPLVRAGLKPTGMGPFGWFFRFQQSGALHLRAVRPRGPWYFYLPWCLLLACCPGRSIWPRPRQLGYWALGWWRKQPRASQLAPFLSLGLRFLVVLLSLLRGATKLAWLILRWCRQERSDQPDWSPCAGHRQGPLALIGPAPGWAASMALVLACERLPLRFATTWAATDPAYPDFRPAWRSSACHWCSSAARVAVAAVVLYLYWFKRSRAVSGPRICL